MHRTLALLTAVLVLGPANLGAQDARPQPELKLPTFKQADWGGKCGAKRENAAACLRDDHFAKLFPRGLIVGDQDGVDGDAAFSIVLQSAEAVAAFLPKDGDPQLLERDHMNPERDAKGSGGSFGAALVAAKLNLAAAAAGLHADASLRDMRLLVLGKGAPDGLEGLPLEDLVRLADVAISGALGPDVKMKTQAVDLDGDGEPEATPTQLYNGLKTFNKSYSRGRNTGLALRSLPDPKDSRTASAKTRDTRKPTASTGGAGQVGDAGSTGGAVGGATVGGAREGGVPTVRESDTPSRDRVGGAEADTGTTRGERGTVETGKAPRTGPGAGPVISTGGTGGTDGAGTGTGTGTGVSGRGKGHDGRGQGHDVPPRGADVRGDPKIPAHAGPAMRGEARTDLVRPRGSEGDAKGTLRVRADDKGRQRFELSVERVSADGGLQLLMEAKPHTGQFELVGRLDESRDHGDEDDDDDGAGKRRFEVDTKQGQRLPFGAHSLADLAGRRLRIMAGRQVLLEGTVPALMVRDRSERDRHDDDDDDEGRDDDDHRGRGRDKGKDKDKDKDKHDDDDDD